MERKGRWKRAELQHRCPSASLFHFPFTIFPFCASVSLLSRAPISASSSQPRRSSSAGTLERYGLISRIGVPSSMSIPWTRKRGPSRPSNRTTVRPIGFGRCGERVANTPCGRSSDGGYAVSSGPADWWKHPDHHQVRKAFDVGKAGFEFRCGSRERLRRRVWRPRPWARRRCSCMGSAPRRSVRR